MILLATNVCSGTLTTLTSGFMTSWVPVAAVAMFAILSILIMVYAIASIISQPSLKTWCVDKGYDLFTAFVIFMAFWSFSNLLCLNISAPMQRAGLLVADYTGGGDIFSIAQYNIATFNTNTLLAANNDIYYGSLLLSAIGRVYITLDVEGVSLSLGLGRITGFITSFTSKALSFIGMFIIIGETMQLLVNSAILLLPLFIVMGVIFRIFVITKGFGGAMLAFGFGLGIILPLMIAIMYGFLNVLLFELSNNTFGGISAFFGLAGGALGALVGFLEYGVLSLIGSGSSSAAQASLATATGFVGAIVSIIGVAASGLLVIPYLSVVVVDIFVSDFSKMMGEKVDFLSLLSTVV